MLSAAMEPSGDAGTSSSCKQELRSKVSKHLSYLAAYIVFGVWCVVAWIRLTDQSFSVILTFGATLQCMGFVLLALKVHFMKSTAGLSSKSLEMYFVFLCFRVASTIFKNGYIPIDRSGDWVYQMLDVMSLFVVSHLLYLIHKTYNSTYQEQEDSLDIFKSILPCAVLAFGLKGHLNGCIFFDWVWAMSLLLETIAMLPQLFLMSKAGGAIDCLTAHFVMCLAASRICALIFWGVGFEELQVEGSFNKAGYFVMTCYSLQLLCFADFMYYYTKGMMKGGPVVLPRDNV